MYLGLDFGTTHTVLAHADRGNYPVVAFLDEDGDAHDFVPTVAAEVDGELVYGFAALEAARHGRPATRSFKRVLGLPGTGPDSTVTVGTAAVPLLGLLTGFFAAVRQALGSSSIGEQLDGSEALTTVVGVPARSNSTQRLLTLEACRRAGFDVVGLVNEPSAASLEFAHRQSRSVTTRRNRVVVYDLGGGTFDASLVQLDGKSHEVLDTFGVNLLGGDDFDEVLADVVLGAAGVDPGSLSPTDRESLVRDCREAKERLSPQSRRVTVEVPGADGRDVTVPVDDFYRAATPLVEATTEAMAPLVGSLDDEAGAPTLEGVAGIYVVGGGSSLPLVPRVLRERFGRRAHRAPMPSGSTAVGLAIAADPTAGYSLRDRLSRGFGVFRERDAGASVAFDAVLDRSLPTAEVVGAAEPHEVVITRRYRASHNIGVFRFVEYSAVDDEGEPRGDLAPMGEVVFPFDPELQRAVAEDAPASAARRLREMPVVHGPGPEVEERYTVDPSGIVSVDITDLTTGYHQEHVLGG